MSGRGTRAGLGSSSPAQSSPLARSVPQPQEHLTEVLLDNGPLPSNAVSVTTAPKFLKPTEQGALALPNLEAKALTAPHRSAAK
eukprot:scaffold331170_cov41-Prasinocladus_malaysianus.AAC.1